MPSVLLPANPVLRSRARFATYAFFFVVGLGFAAWVVNIPAIQLATGVDKALLGSLILLLGLGSFTGMQLAGPFVDKWGSKLLSLIGALIFGVAVFLPGLATSPWQLAGALLLFGFGMGVVDVAMNAQAVVVEKAYGRPIMSSFHALFSVGGGVGALIGAGTKAMDLGPSWSLGIGAAVILLVAISCFTLMLDDHDAEAPASALMLATAGADAQLEAPDLSGSATPAAPAAPAAAKAGQGRVIALLAMLAFVIMLAEGTASDWSAVHAVDVRGQSEALAALAYFSFAVAMTAGRFVTDALVHRFGAVAVVRTGSAIGMIGLLGVMFAPDYPLTLAAWLVFGLGVAGIIPQIFSAAGRLGGARPGVVISRVVGSGYLGLLAGPALVGWLSQLFGLNLALLLPLLCCVAGLLLARQVATQPQPLSAVQQLSAR